MTAARKMPPQLPATSEQVVQTDPAFIAAVVKRFGKLDVDLAATAENTQAPMYISKETNSLRVPWADHFYLRTTMWLNPEFKNIEPWAEKCAYESARIYSVFGKGRILLLTPASVGSNWFRDHVDGKARVYLLNGRLRFVGHKQPYPKDCILSVYGEPPGYEVWSWK